LTGRPETAKSPTSNIVPICQSEIVSIDLLKKQGERKFMYMAGSTSQLFLASTSVQFFIAMPLSLTYPSH
jgi:hypothetical protein